MSNIDWSKVVTVADKIAAKAEGIRATRDSKLAVCDWTQNSDSPLDEDAKEAWRSYRQALRDIPEQESFPDDITWPDEPKETAIDDRL